MTTRDLAHSTARHSLKTHLTTRTGRQWLVAGMVAACAALILLGILGVRTPLAFVLIGLLVADDALLMYVTSSMAELSERAVDERQEAVRNHAYRLAYRIVTHALIWPTVLIVLLASFADPFGWLAALWSNTALVIAIGTSMTQLLAFLPTMILAWTEPDLGEAE